jgi:acetyl-CoA decarbonylase/synthase complex subunit delta
VGQEVWKVKEVRGGLEDFPQGQGGDPSMRAVMWEAMTAMAMIHAGADILTMAHPAAIKIVRREIDDLMGGVCL